MKQSHPNIREILQRRAADSFGVDHEDKNMVDLFPVPLIIVGTKYDLFQVKQCFYLHNYVKNIYNRI